MKFGDFYKMVQTCANDTKNSRFIPFAGSVHSQKLPDDPWWPLDKCAKCFSPLKPNDEVLYDEINLKVYCDKCQEKLRRAS